MPRRHFARQASLESYAFKAEVAGLPKVGRILYNHSNPCQWVIIFLVVGDWPSGKALGSGPRIGGSNPSSPARVVMTHL